MQIVFPFRLVAALTACLVAASGAAHADPSSSRWSSGVKSGLRLLSAGAGSDGVLKAGIEIRLSPGFKTYWRSPGDSGIPPRFDWSGSENVAGITVNWPAPVRFADGSGFSVGYTSDVILPVGVRATNPALPVKLALKLEYAVCEKICIPVTGDANLVLATSKTPEAPRIDVFKARVPVPAARAGRDSRPAAIDGTVVHGPAGQMALQVVAALPKDNRFVDMFIEGPDMWAFGRPTYKPAPDGQVIAVFEIAEKPKSATGEVPFVVTITGEPASIEIQLDLDISPPRP